VLLLLLLLLLLIAFFPLLRLGNAIASVPLIYPLTEPLLSLYHPLWLAENVEEAKRQESLRDQIAPDIDQVGETTIS
jgi:hypothetical protein